MKVNSNYFNLISIEVFVWPLVDLVDLTHILDFSVHPTCVDAVMSGPMDFSMKISPEMKRNATICDIYFKIWLLGKRWPILIFHSQTINTIFPILEKQTDWCYILRSPKPPIGTQVKHLLILLSILLLSSPLFGQETDLLFSLTTSSRL